MNKECAHGNYEGMHLCVQCGNIGLRISLLYFSSPLLPPPPLSHLPLSVTGTIKQEEAGGEAGQPTCSNPRQ